MVERQAVEAPQAPVWGDLPITLGGVQKPIRPLAARPSRDWKTLLAEKIRAATKDIEVSGSDWGQVLTLLSDLTDLQVELLVAYDREGRLGSADWILDNASEREIYEAFKAVLIEAFPPLADAQRFPQLLAGLLPQLLALSGNSASTNGAGPETS